MTEEQDKATPQKAAEVIIWDERHRQSLDEISWPTYMEHTMYLRAGPATLGSLLHDLTPLGYRIKSVLTYRYGFLWLKKAREIIFEREVDWVRRGSEQSYVGSRTTGHVHTQLAAGKVVSPEVDF